ncbi:MAG: YfhO family protein [Chloroflexota bacterium]
MSRFSKLSTQYPALSTLWPYAAIIGLTLLFFYKLAFTGMILARGDMYAYFYPYWTVRSAAFLSGHIPLWTPDIFMGVPLLANSQIGVFYPPNWIVTPFDAPTAITISLLLHVVWAMTGAYRLARATLNLDQLPALLAAAVFGLGGYLGAKVENINQFQALAWMPWLFLLLHFALVTPTIRQKLRFGLLLGIGIALQLLAGHPQTVFITAIGLGVYALSFSPSPLLWRGGWGVRFRMITRALILLAFAGLIGIILAAPQLIPTLELSRASNRSGGLLPQQAMAFSLNPWIIGRGLLPSYDGLIFGEYLTYVGIIAMGLAIVGIFSSSPANRMNDLDSPSPLLWRGRPKGVGVRFPWIILLIVGFGLALGLYNPLYWTLASLPGFSFFRVPARWLALFALAAALLAGVGLQSLKIQRPRWWVFALIIVLIAGLARASFLADVMAMDVIGPAEPTARTLIAWALAAVILLAGMWIAPRIQTKYVVSILGILAIVELFAASRVLAYNEVAPPDTFAAQRFTISQLRAYAAEQTPPGRVLSISQALFDPGDIAALTARYHELGMSDLAIRIALVDTKLRELLAANLPLVWGIPSIDGFDGGLLPTGDYSSFTSLMLPPGEERSIDGRLREMLAQPECRGACIPDQRWLDLTNTRYLITDKTADLVKDGIFYDTTLTYNLDSDVQIAVDPGFTANAVDMLYTSDVCTPSLTCAPLLSGQPPTTVESVNSFTLARWTLADPQSFSRLSLSVPETMRMGIHAITLVDTRVDVFQQVTLPPWKRVLSSDIKLYQNQTVLPRAFVVHDVAYNPDGVSDTESALALMRDSDFIPNKSVVFTPTQNSSYWVGGAMVNPQMIHSNATILAYTPERVDIQVDSTDEGFLLLTDTYYPGWVATVNGEMTPIYKADVMFRAVKVPPGKSTVIFEYKPGWWPGILILGAVTWLLALLIGFILFRNPLKSRL